MYIAAPKWPSSCIHSGVCPVVHPSSNTYPFTFLAPVIATYESPLYPSVELHTEAMLNEIPEIDAATYNRGFATMSSFL